MDDFNHEDFLNEQLQSIQNNAYPSPSLPSVDTDIRHKTTVEYYGSQLPKLEKLEYPIWFGLDWLQYNLRGDFFNIQSAHDWEVQDMPFKSRQFKSLRLVSFQGIKLLEVKGLPHSKLIDSDLVQVKLMNHQLYTNKDLVFILDLFQKQFNLKFIGLSRVDIAVDAYNFMGHTPKTLFEGVYTGELIKKGKSAFVPFFNKGTSYPTGLAVGKKGSKSKYVRVYDKSLEMLTNEKEHIKNNWLRCGFDLDHTIYRYEIQLQTAFWSEYKSNIATSIHWSDLFHNDRLVDILQMANHNYFHFTLNEGFQKQGANTEIPILDFEKLGLTTENFGYTKVKRNSQKGSVRSRLMCLKSMFRTYFETYQDSVYGQVMTSYISEYGLDETFKNKFGEWLNEFKNDALRSDSFDSQQAFKDFDFHKLQTELTFKINA